MFSPYSKIVDCQYGVTYCANLLFMSPEREQHQIDLDDIVSTAKEVMLKLGRHVPTLTIETSKKILVGQIPDMPATHGERVELMRFLGQAAAKSGRVDQLHQVFMAHEGWLSLSSEEMRPSQDPNRKEVLIISAIQVKDRKKHVRVFEILRNKDEKVIDLEEFLPEASKDERTEAPLLDAFVQGFQLAFRARSN